MNPYYCSVNVEPDRWHTYFAFRLKAIGVASQAAREREQFARGLIARQAELIGTFSGLGQGAALELRYIRDAGGLEVVLRARQAAETQSAAEEGARRLLLSSWAGLVGMTEAYQWEMIGSEAEYRAQFGPGRFGHHVAIARRELSLHLDTAAAPRRSAGFITPELKQQVENPSDPTVCMIAPFRRTDSTLEYLCRLLLMREETSVLSIAIQPTRVSSAESVFVQGQMMQCERYIQLPSEGPVSVATTFSPPLRTRAGIALQALEQMSLTQTDEVFAVRIQLSSSGSIPSGLVDAVGGSITQSAVAPTDGGRPSYAESLLSGGYDHYTAGTDEQRRQATANLDNLEFVRWHECLLPSAVGRLRLLMGAHEAVAAFRLPLPIDGRFPGIETMLSRYIVCDSPLPEDGLLLGHNTRLGRRAEVRMTDDDRRRHCYIVGQTGTGKTTLLLNMIRQDIAAGRGVAVFDPHGDLIDRVKEVIPPERQGDVIHYDPLDPGCKVAINLFDCVDAADRDRATNHLLEMFNAFYDMKEAGGPIFEDYFRNSVALLTAEGRQPGTLFDMQRLFTDEDFRESLVKQCAEQSVAKFWRLAGERSGDYSNANTSFYITSKLNRLTGSAALRPLLSQPRSNVDLLRIMDQRKILLLDLNKGFLGKSNCSLVGALWISLIERATFRRETSRTAVAASQPFNLYVDEFQQFAFESFVALLAEARKFGLNITIANQYLDQMPKEVLDAVLGNVGSIITFRVGQKDAERLKDLFVPTVYSHDLALLPNHRAFIKTLVRGQALLPFSLEALKG